MTSPQIEWDWGTAYDLFVSLDVLHNPAEYGVRAAWTAGMRARLSPGERATLEDGVLLVGLPLHWIYTLPEPKDVEAALWTLGQIPPEGRLPALARFPHDSQEVADLLQAVAARGHWREEDRRALRTAHLCSPKVDQPLSPEDIVTILDHWSDPGEFGQRYLPALRSYQEVFFAEEEARIVPALREAVGRAQALAAQMALPELVEELSQGLRLADLPADARVVLAPSYWCTPLLGMNTLDDGRRIYLFGARPADASLVPGEVVPDPPGCAFSAT
jgi:hypothetical protein